MAVRAKMYVSEVKRMAYNREQVTVSLQCSTRGPENAEWAAATPSGQVTLHVMNPAASQQFVEAFDSGKEFWVDFTPVSEETSPPA